ncbi:MAG: hypothetical protein IH851_09250 [Armatimonadetes bacterium]|nr:hypothetical protein [Armatimonadota bacterium]
MKVLIVERNLIWTARLSKAVAASGHEGVVVSGIGEELPATDLAIVNLSDPALRPFECVEKLRSAGVPVLGHAGHKEKELWEKGRDAGCDRIVSNGEITFKLPEILKEFAHAG